MTSYLLIPGACHGGWWYDDLSGRLRAEGHLSQAITLAGLEDTPTIDVITGVADRMPERVKALVYLEAFLPRDGDSCWAMTNDEQRAWYTDGARRTGYGVDREDPQFETQEWDTTHNVMADGPDRVFALIRNM